MTSSKHMITPPGWRVRAREKRLILVLGDLLVGYIALGLALYLWSLLDAWSLTFWRERVAGWYYFVPLIWLVLLISLYDPHRVNNWRVTTRGILGAAVIGGAFYALVYMLVRGTQARIGVGFFLALAATLTLLWRLFYIRIFTSRVFLRRVLILGTGKSGMSLLEAYQSLTPEPFQLIGFVDDNPREVSLEIKGYPVISNSEGLMEVISRERISDLVVAMEGAMQGRTFQVVLDAQDRGVEIIPMPVLYEELLGRVPIQHLESEWLIRSFIIDARPPLFYELINRILDICGALLGLLVFAVIFPFIALGILIDTGTPILYPQIRSGKGGRSYTVWKFRTMIRDAEKNGIRVTVEDDTRITRMGKILRRVHLDEFPQFWNVLLGQMSIIGPRAERPELIKEFENVIPFYRARLMIKPGITGWAQVNYAYPVTMDEVAVKLEFDLYYIKHRNLLMDISILFRTFWHSLGMQGR